MLYSVCVFSCADLFVSISLLIGCEDCLQNDLDCVRCGIKLYFISNCEAGWLVDDKSLVTACVMNGSPVIVSVPCQLIDVVLKFGNKSCYVTRWPSGKVPDLQSRGRGFESHQRLLCTNANSACHPSRVG